MEWLLSNIGWLIFICFICFLAFKIGMIYGQEQKEKLIRRRYKIYQERKFWKVAHLKAFHHLNPGEAVENHITIQYLVSTGMSEIYFKTNTSIPENTQQEIKDVHKKYLNDYVFTSSVFIGYFGD